ncbi:MAG: sigma-70 family RNA polymerase sigma factor [Clostridia bacterium]|jgi:RNA polymerase sigma factor (sigma-70 family)|nr:sigma-70 family RNA polymerase sigma factor [Clostridia bacterium]
MDIEQIYNEYFKMVYKYLICLTHNKEIAEDLAQETFCKAIKSIQHFRGECKISVWLCEIAKNLWFNELRKMKKVSSLDMVDDIDILYNIEEEFLKKQDLEQLYNKIQKLDETVREIFYMKLFSNLTFKQIGAIKGKSEVWARVNFYRGKQKLKEVDENE